MKRHVHILEGTTASGTLVYACGRESSGPALNNREHVGRAKLAEEGSKVTCPSCRRRYKAKLRQHSRNPGASSATPGDWARGLAVWRILAADPRLVISRPGVPGELGVAHVRAALEDARRHAKGEAEQARHAAATLAVWLREPWLYEEAHGRMRKNPDYRETHGGKVGDWNAKRVKVPDPRKKLTVMGRLRRVEYETDKGRGAEIFTHTFGRAYAGAEERGAPKEERKPWLVFNDDGIVVAGGHYVVREEGIVG